MARVWLLRVCNADFGAGISGVGVDSVDEGVTGVSGACVDGTGLGRACMGEAGVPGAG